MSVLPSQRRTASQPKERGAALVEFAIVLPIFIALLALVFDAGLGFSNSRDSSSAVRAAARVGALAGDSREADFRVLDALRAEYGNGEDVNRIRIYRTSAANTDGLPPATCGAGCNEYPGAVLGSLGLAADADAAGFGTVVVGLDASGDAILDCAPGSPDASWCPLGRRADEGSFLGVHVESRADATVGIGTSGFDLENRSVFALYFPPLPVQVPSGN